MMDAKRQAAGRKGGAARRDSIPLCRYCRKRPAFNGIHACFVAEAAGREQGRAEAIREQRPSTSDVLASPERGTSVRSEPESLSTASPTPTESEEQP